MNRDCSPLATLDFIAKAQLALDTEYHLVLKATAPDCGTGVFHGEIENWNLKVRADRCLNHHPIMWPKGADEPPFVDYPCAVACP